VRATAAVVGLGLVAAVAAAPAYAGGSHTRIVNRTYDERPTVTQLNGLGPGCPDFVGTFTERRHVTQSGYIRHDVAHIGTVATATVTLRPAAAGAVSYAGSYREVQKGVFLHHGHLTRSQSDITVGHIRGSDGSTYETVEVKHTWRGKDGREHTTDTFHCD
jgi:hypothetical protein